MDRRPRPLPACAAEPLLRQGPGSDNRGYVNRDPSQPGPRCAGWGYFLAAFFLRSAQ